MRPESGSVAHTPMLRTAAGDAQFRQYLLYAGPPNLIGMAVLLFLYARYGDGLLLYFAACTLVNAGLYALAYRRSQTQGAAAAAPVICYGMWWIVLSCAFTEARMFPLAILMAMMPLIAIVPYVSLGRLLRLCLACIGLIALYAVLMAAGVTPESFPTVPREPFYYLVNWGIPVCVAIGGLSLWQTARTLGYLAADVERANAALARSGHDLEQRVGARSAELQESRAQLEQARDASLAASRHKSVFLANMSHELRTPLNAILGFSEALHAQLFGPLQDKQQEYVGDIHRSGQHLLGLINNILDQARIEAGRYVIQPQPVAIGALLREVVRGFEARAAEAGLRLQLLAPAEATLVTDAATLRKILHNLLDNAIKFTSAGGHVELSAGPQDDGWRFSVSDNGAGLSAADAERVFDAFSRGSRREHPMAGAGLGLSLCAYLAGLLRGRIWVESEPGGGAQFHFTIGALPAQAGS